MEFEDDTCNILNKKDGKIAFTTRKECNAYVLYPHELVSNVVKYLNIYKEDGYMWHKRLGRIGMDLLKRLSIQELVRGLPSMSFEKTHLCDACHYSIKNQNLS